MIYNRGIGYVMVDDLELWFRVRDRARMRGLTLNFVLEFTSTVNWAQAGVHYRSRLASPSKLLLVIDKLRNQTTFSDLALIYGISRSSCHRIYHETCRLIVDAFGFEALQSLSTGQGSHPNVQPIHYH